MEKTDSKLKRNRESQIKKEKKAKIKDEPKKRKTVTAVNSILFLTFWLRCSLRYLHIAVSYYNTLYCQVIITKMFMVTT